MTITMMMVKKTVGTGPEKMMKMDCMAIKNQTFHQNLDRRTPLESGVMKFVAIIFHTVVKRKVKALLMEREDSVLQISCCIFLALI